MPAPTNGVESSPQETRERTTSAKRLLRLLALAKGAVGLNAYRVYPAVMSRNSSSEQVELGWAFTECMVVVAKMIADFELEVAASGLSDEEKAYHLECRPLLINAVAPVRMGQPWDQVKTAISETIISKLQSADMALRRSVTEQMLTVADLRDLRAGVSAALEATKESALPTELKAFISMHLVRIRTAMDEYEYRGSGGLQDALAGYLGGLGSAKEQIAIHATDPQKRKLTDVLSVANAAVTLAHGAAWAWPHLVAGATMIAGLLA